MPPPVTPPLFWFGVKIYFLARGFVFNALSLPSSIIKALPLFMD